MLERCLFSLGMGTGFNAILDPLRLVAWFMEIGSLSPLIRLMFSINNIHFLWSLVSIIRRKAFIKSIGNLVLES